MTERGTPGVHEVDERRAAKDIGYFIEYLRAFLDYGEADRRALLASATLILPSSRELLDAVYGRLLSFSSTRRFFVGADGQPNDLFLEKRRKTLFEWLAHTAAGHLDARLGHYVVEVASRHVVRTDPGGPPVPLTEIDALFAVLGVEVAKLLERVVKDPAELNAYTMAWSKMLAAQRAIFARVYQEAGRGAGAP